MSQNTHSVELDKDKDCQGSVRFSAPKTQPGGKPGPTNSIYVNRSVDGINNARRVRVTIEIVE